MKRLVLESLIALVIFEFMLRFRSFASIHAAVRNYKIRAQSESSRPGYTQICRAVDLACSFYFRRVLCLQRSAATAVLLRHYGWPCTMVIGAQIVPLRSHAWVEIAGMVVNDKPYMSDLYHVLERC